MLVYQQSVFLGLKDLPVASRIARIEKVLKENAETLLETLNQKRLGFGAMRRDKDLVPAGPFLDLLKHTFREHSPFDDPKSQFGPNGWQLLGDRLAKVQTFSTFRDHAFFWSLIEAEGAFLEDFLPFCSHEERATGALLNSMIMSARSYSSLCSLGGTGKVGPAIYFYDTSTDCNEKHTGADVGLIVRSGEASNPLIKVARLQVKISEQSGTRPRRFLVGLTNKSEQAPTKGFPRNHENFVQLRTLADTPQLGYYLLINEKGEGGDNVVQPCLIAPAMAVSYAIAQSLGTPPKVTPLVDLSEKINPIPLFAFLGIAMTSRGSGYGVELPQGTDRSDALERAETILFGKDAQKPRYRLIVDTTADPLKLNLVSKGVPGKPALADIEPIWEVPSMALDATPPSRSAPDTDLNQEQHNSGSGGIRIR
ncbi:hypothetical protein [Rhizobium sp. Root1220]|uniref:hypothetical protein n=1 Tax=Rhizobium sp. Root1220 TaxID=1736432 RepID=UPI0006FE75EF|nr:hypothetical protein [Rhizobium sp. Root1220]KQV83407.1 hypothetical protein ASC90_20920 [Rhizobium sp. Root1220]